MKTLLLFLVLCSVSSNSLQAQWLDGGRAQSQPTMGNSGIFVDHNGALYFFNEENFLQKSTDNGAHWVNLSDSGLPKTAFTTSFRHFSEANGRIYAGMNFGNGTGAPFYSSDAGETWVADTMGAPGHALGWNGLPAVNDIYAWGHWVYINWDGPNLIGIKTFNGPWVRNDTMAFGIGQPMQVLASGDTLFMLGGKFYYTVDGGATFYTPKNNGYYPSFRMFKEGSRIWTCANKVWNQPFVMLYTDDNGENWNEVAVDSLASKHIINGDLVRPNAMFIKGNDFWFCVGTMAFNSPPSVWHSSDRGKTFVYDTAGLASNYVPSASEFAYTFDGSLWVVPNLWNIFRKKIDNGIQQAQAVTHAPVLVKPFHGWNVPTTSPLLIWSKTANAASYQVQVSTDPTFATSFVDKAGIVDTSYALADLTIGTTYYWRVRGTGDDQKNGPWATDNFTIVPAQGVANASTPNLRVTPNPASDHIQIEGNALQSVSITDLLGKEVARIDNINGDACSVALTGIPYGVYTVSVITRDGAHTQTRIVVQ